MKYKSDETAGRQVVICRQVLFYLRRILLHTVLPRVDILRPNVFVKEEYGLGVVRGSLCLHLR